MTFENEQFQQQDHDRRQEHKDRYPVDPVHVPHPLGIRLIRVPLFNVEVFFDLSPDSHAIKLLQNPLYLHPALQTTERDQTRGISSVG